MEAHYGFCEAGSMCSHKIRFNSVFEMLVGFIYYLRMMLGAQTRQH
jgi:hypothetical protein